MPDLKVNITSNPPMSIKLQTPQTQTITMTGNVQPGTKNYNNLTNLPQINGETLIGDKTSADLHIVSENTEAGWEEMYDYVPKHGEICLYTDTDKIKIGDGTVQIVDLPYIEGGSAEEFARSLRVHVNNYSIHVSEEDRVFWDNKADKVSSTTNGNFAALDANGNLTDSGHKHSDYLTSHQDISGKIDKPSSPATGAFLVYNGTAWVAQTLSTWQGGSY